MVLHPVQLPLPPLNPLAQGPPAQNLPTLWSQLEPFRRQELAQHLAEMIRRLRLQVCPPDPSTEHSRQEAANDHR